MCSYITGKSCWTGGVEYIRRENIDICRYGTQIKGELNIVFMEAKYSEEKI
jgi:hypothetical protein